MSDIKDKMTQEKPPLSMLSPVGDGQSLPSLIAEQLRLMITNRVLKPGDKLDSEPDLARRLNVSRITLREAIQNLVLEGLLIRKRGIGTFVATYLSIENPLNRNTSVTDFIQSQNAAADTIDMTITTQAASAYVAKMLRLNEDDPIIYIKRTRTANGHPVIFSKEHLSIACLTSYHESKDMAAELATLLAKNQSLNDVLKNTFGIRFNHAYARISALNADEYLADKLILTTGDSLLRLEQVDFDNQDIPIMLSNEYYPGQSTFSVYRTG